MSKQSKLDLLRFFANLTLCYPVALIALLYCEWLLAWHLLGHKPVTGADDPLRINGVNWIDSLTGLGVLGMIPANILAVFLNSAYVFQRRPSAIQAGIRVLSLVCFWLGLYVWFQGDMHGVASWWRD